MVTWRKAVWALAGSSCVIIILQVTCSICGIAFGEAFTFGLFAQKNLYQYQPVPCLFDTPESKSRCPPYYIDINKYDLTNFTFITGASSNHFEEGKDLIASIQQHFPGKIIYYYDLGLDTNQVAEEALLRFDAVFWLDASGRISPEESRPDWDSVFETARLTDGIIMFDRTGRDTFQCTTRGMYRLFIGGASAPGQQIVYNQKVTRSTANPPIRECLFATDTTNHH
ncbi:hypothetical protein LSH36_1311g00007 [Paralvinella palmiformis]|uniref:Uncharacterized protein n=1 Tax=Paralvinella palmiformis TaxID=53620 RepID=A0AAD9IUL6_9ANNE|nr:hypothetical protein LSH36_1311g00007 [Paralvinella palmiformis]